MEWSQEIFILLIKNDRNHPFLHLSLILYNKPLYHQSPPATSRTTFAEIPSWTPYLGYSSYDSLSSTQWPPVQNHVADGRDSPSLLLKHLPSLIGDLLVRPAWRIDAELLLPGRETWFHIASVGRQGKRRGGRKRGGSRQRWAH